MRQAVRSVLRHPPHHVAFAAHHPTQHRYRRAPLQIAVDAVLLHIRDDMPDGRFVGLGIDACLCRIKVLDEVVIDQTMIRSELGRGVAGDARDDPPPFQHDHTLARLRQQQPRG